MLGVCSLRAEESQGLPCTTDPDELVAWMRAMKVQSPPAGKSLPKF
jgi:hypothetical protein